MSSTRLVSDVYPEIYNGERSCFEGLEAETRAHEKFVFFCKNNLILNLFW